MEDQGFINKMFFWGKFIVIFFMTKQSHNSSMRRR